MSTAETTRTQILRYCSRSHFNEHIKSNLLRSKLGVVTSYCENESTFHTSTTSVHHQPIRKVSDFTLRGNTEIGIQCTDHFANCQMKPNDNNCRDASTSTDDLHSTITMSSAIDSFRQSNNSANNINDCFSSSPLKNQDSVNPENRLLNTVHQSSRKNQKLIDGTSTSSLNVFLQTPKKDGISDGFESTVLPSSFLGTLKSLSPTKNSDQLVSSGNVPFIKSYDCSSIVTEAQNIGSKDIRINPTNTQVLISNNDLLKANNSTVVVSEQSRNHFDTLTLSANKLLLSPSVKSDNAVPIQSREHSKSQYNETAMSNETFQITNQQHYHYHHNHHSAKTHSHSPTEQTAWENNIATLTEKSHLVVSLRHTSPKVRETEATSSEHEKANCEGGLPEASSNNGMFPKTIASNDKVALPNKIVNSKKTCLREKNPGFVPQNACAVHKKSVSDRSLQSSANTLHRTAEENAACVDKEQVKNLDSSSESNELQKTDFGELEIPILNHNYESMVSHYHTPAKIRPSILSDNGSIKDSLSNESKRSVPWDYNLRQSLVDDVQNSVNTSKPVEKCKKTRTPGKKRKTDETRDEKLMLKKFKIFENACVDLTKSNSEAKESNLRLHQSNYAEKKEVTNNDCKGRSPHQVKGGDNKSKNNLLTEIGKKRITKSGRESDIGKVKEVKIENKKTKEELNSRSELSKVREVVKENAAQISVDATIDNVIRDKSDLISKGIVVKEMNIRQLSENQMNESNNGREVNVKSLHGSGKASIKLSKMKYQAASSKNEKRQTPKPNCKVPLVGEIATRSPDVSAEIILYKTNTVHDAEKSMPVKLQQLDSVKNNDILNNFNDNDNDDDDENWQARLKMTEEIVLLHNISSRN